MPYKESVIEKVYYTIGEVAKMINQATSTLRFWEGEFSFLKIKKGKKGDRVYVRDDIELVMKINFMMTKGGFTVKGVKTAHKMGYMYEMCKMISDRQRNYIPPTPNKPIMVMPKAPIKKIYTKRELNSLLPAELLKVHRDEDNHAVKGCPTCGEIKYLVEFYKFKNRPMRHCVLCTRAKQDKRLNENKGN